MPATRRNMWTVMFSSRLLLVIFQEDTDLNWDCNRSDGSNTSVKHSRNLSFFNMILTINQATFCLVSILIVSNCFYFFQTDKCVLWAASDHDTFNSRRKEGPISDYLERLKDEPYLFIGGFPRSGTTLLRVILDGHPMISCGPETRILPTILRIRQEFSSLGERSRLHEADINTEITDRLFLMAMDDIKRSRNLRSSVGTHSHLRTCFKDPFTLRYTSYLEKLLPKAKFILLVRDGRAVAYSIQKRNVKIAGLNSNNIEDILREWNFVTNEMVDQCLNIGKKCLLIHYEKLVLSERKTLMKILKFLRVPWYKDVLKHWENIQDSAGPKLSRYEPSYSQVIKPVYNSSLHKWLNLPRSILLQANKVAPMLEALGYPTKLMQHDYSKL